jgi:sterol 3beta-glucosyltransferase
VRVLVLTLGTRGDVQPFVALARGVRDADHDVVLAVVLAWQRRSPKR